MQHGIFEKDEISPCVYKTGDLLEKPEPQGKTRLTIFMRYF